VAAAGGVGLWEPVGGGYLWLAGRGEGRLGIDGWVGWMHL
jgi:hypothetical protein